MPSSALPPLSTLSLPDALPISPPRSPWPSRPQAPLAARAAAPRSAGSGARRRPPASRRRCRSRRHAPCPPAQCCRRRSACAPTLRSEEHTSELQSLRHLVCRLLRSLPSPLFPYPTLFRSHRRDPLGLRVLKHRSQPGQLRLVRRVLVRVGGRQRAGGVVDHDDTHRALRPSAVEGVVRARQP